MAHRWQRLPAYSLRANALLSLILLTWIGAIFFGMTHLLRLQYTPAVISKPAQHWPLRSTIHRYGNGPVLVIFAHPRCPCSRATIGELARIMSHTSAKVQAVVLFLKPRRFKGDWEKTDLWRTAESIPGVNVLLDRGGAEAALFNASVSGETLLYDGDGRLVFNGGITASRGHAGDNDGEDAIVSYFTTGNLERSWTNSFGCSLLEHRSTDPRTIDYAWR